eukprot:Gb_34111 [translate_table: standard]
MGVKGTSLSVMEDMDVYLNLAEYIDVPGMERERWVLGGGWNNENWGGEMPKASWIDNITHHNPVWLSRMDGHMGLANSVALAKTGIKNMTCDPIGGTVVRSNDGVPTGLLVDAAMQLLLPHIPEATVKERRDAMIRASKLGLSRGVTAVVDFGRYFPGSSTTSVWQDFSEVYKWADATGHMLLRVCIFFPLETWSRVAAIHIYGVLRNFMNLFSPEMQQSRGTLIQKCHLIVLVEILKLGLKGSSFPKGVGPF